MFRLKQPRVVMVVLISALILLAGGCSKSSRNGGTLNIPELYVGTEGVSASFAPETAPGTITGGSTTDSVLLLTNKGAVDSPAVLVSIRDTKGVFTVNEVNGLEGNLEFIPPSQITGMIEGKETAKSVTGAIYSLTLSLKARDLLKDEQAFTTNLLATACYQYETKLTANVCVDASSYSFQKQRKPCDPNVPILLKSQGAPVAIKRIETITEKSGDYVRPKFKIYMDNVGAGLVIDKSALSLFCSTQSQNDDKSGKQSGKLDRFWLDKVELGGQELACSDVDDEGNKVGLSIPNNYQKDYLLCAYTGNAFQLGSGAFATPLKVELSYGYALTSVPVPVRVEKGIQCEEGAERSCSITGGVGTQKCIGGHWTFCQK